MGYVKGKSAIYVARTFGGRKRDLAGEHPWAPGYYVSTTGTDDEEVRRYIRERQK